MRVDGEPLEVWADGEIGHVLTGDPGTSVEVTVRDLEGLDRVIVIPRALLDEDDAPVPVTARGHFY